MDCFRDRLWKSAALRAPCRHRDQPARLLDGGFRNADRRLHAGAWVSTFRRECEWVAAGQNKARSIRIILWDEAVGEGPYTPVTNDGQLFRYSDRQVGRRNT